MTLTSTYNTRRKSLSLEALGVQIPGVSRAHSHRISTDSKHDASESQTPASSASHSSPPSKRLKRSHSPPATTTPSSPTSQRPLSAGLKVLDTAAGSSVATQTKDAPRPPTRHVEYTPPPSPPADDSLKIEYEAINDDIVEGVVRQLEKTGNRPHLIKELAAVLSTTHDAVTSSANAPALLSSRLANYMKRPCWNGQNPCPVGKELIPIHPRKVFYYLTDRNRLELPDTSDDIYGPLGITEATRVTPPAATATTPGVGVMGPPSSVPAKRPFAPSMPGSVGYNVSPPLSNASVVEDDVESVSVHDRGRFAMSPSPEVDLSIHNTDYEHGDEEQAMDSQTVHSSADAIRCDYPTPSADSSSQSSSSSTRSVVSRTDKSDVAERPLNPRHQAIPLEGDEHEFMGTARSFRERSAGSSTPMDVTAEAKKVEGTKEQDNTTGDNRYELFQQPQKGFAMSSPAFQAQSESKHQSKASINDVMMMDAEIDLGEGLYRWDFEAPNDVKVDDLDSLLADL